MKKLTVKTFEFAESKEQPSTIDLVKACLKSPRRDGFSVDDVRHRIRIEDACNAAKDNTISLEDADAKNLKAIVAEMRWAVSEKAIVDFHEQIEKL
jgi:hypothetical protein